MTHSRVKKVPRRSECANENPFRPANCSGLLDLTSLLSVANSYNMAAAAAAAADYNIRQHHTATHEDAANDSPDKHRWSMAKDIQMKSDVRESKNILINDDSAVQHVKVEATSASVTNPIIQQLYQQQNLTPQTHFNTAASPMKPAEVNNLLSTYQQLLSAASNATCSVTPANMSPLPANTSTPCTSSSSSPPVAEELPSPLPLLHASILDTPLMSKDAKVSFPLTMNLLDKMVRSMLRNDERSNDVRFIYYDFRPNQSTVYSLLPLERRIA